MRPRRQRPRRGGGTGAAIAAVVGAGCSYTPGTFSTYYTGTLVGERAVVGCLDVALQRRGDVEGAPVIEYWFGNRCARPVTLDFSRVVVVGRTASGEEVTLRPFDPTMELRPLAIDGRYAGTESLAYPTTTPMVQVCIDAATIATDDGNKEPHWMCFASNVVAPPAAPSASDPVADDATRVDEGEAHALAHEERSL